MSDAVTPFHSGELAAQQRAGVGDISSWAASYIRDYMPDQHRKFYQDQPFLVAASSDAEGRVWATIVEGPDGFVQSPDARTLSVNTWVDPQDPLAKSISNGADIGMIGIELATRRRNRLSGRTRPTDTGFAIDIRQSFGNCPQYINERDWWRVEQTEAIQATTSSRLDASQIARISAADTLFIGSGRHGAQRNGSDGFDASHRGGERGFVQVVSPNRLRIPDYSGNNFFNTIGNLLEDPRIGLLFVDFETGGLTHLTGRAQIEWEPRDVDDPSVLRMIDVEIDTVIDRPGALSLRWTAEPAATQKLVVLDKKPEAEGIVSFHLKPADGNLVSPFQAGQHLPIALDIPGHDTKVRRSYSISGSMAQDHYRITVKREHQGIASRFLHDNVDIGDELEARPPAGDFLIPTGEGPLVLVSAGVGLTPMVALLHEVARQTPSRPVWFVHGARNGHYHAMRDEVDHLISTMQSARRQVYYSRPESTDQEGKDFDMQGRISAADLLDLEVGVDADFMLCGPMEFVTDLRSGLEAAGFDRNQIHYETFG